MFLRFPCSLRPKFVSSSSQNGTLPLRIDMHSGAGKLYCVFTQSPARIHFSSSLNGNLPVRMDMHSGAGNWRFLVLALSLRPKFVSSRSHGAAGTPALLSKSLLLFCEPKKAAPQKQKRGLAFFFEPALRL